MGLINNFKTKYVYNKEKDKFEFELVWNGLVATHTFLNNFSFKRANKPFKCGICQKEKPKNTRYLGDNYDKVCCDCSPEWFENSIKALQEMEMLINNSKKDLKLNKYKWRKEMILGSLN